MRKAVFHRVLFVFCLGISILSFNAQADDGTTHYPLEGSGTEASPYLIRNVRDLRYLHLRMLEKEDFSQGRFFRLTSDLRLNDRLLDESGELLTTDTTLFTQWTPIGKEETRSSYRAFQGVFDGDGHTIYGLYINHPSENGQGLFGTVRSNGIIRNLHIADSYICGTGATGSICGTCNDGLIIDCTSSAMVVSKGATHQAGGIAGSASGSKGRLLRCINKGYVTGVSLPNEWGELYNCYTGGICGDVSSAKVDSCTNIGRVFGNGWGAAGGISGGVSGGAQIRWCLHKGSVSSNVNASLGGIAGNNSQTVLGCCNEGEVTATTKGSRVGGIVGTTSWNSRIYDCTNKADLRSDVDSIFAGGIVGFMDGGINYGTYYTPAAYRCVNHGTIQTTRPLSQAGGISGKNYCAEIHDCENHGNVYSAARAGGISPRCEFHSEISGCSNTGEIQGGGDTGGIVGETNGSVSRSWNSGRVSNLEGGSYAGGIAGSTSSGISDCFNTGEICDTRHGGGIAGNNKYKSYIQSCYNAGYIHTEKDQTSVGGIGCGNGTVVNSYNAGVVETSGKNCTAGGITYNVWVSFDSHGNRSGSTAENCYNMGLLRTRSADSRVGNIAGTYNSDDASLLFKNCYYLKEAIQSDSCILSDRENSNLTAIEKDGFRTLAQHLNVDEYWWDETPDAFVQGYYRPVLNGTSANDAPLYYAVTTLDGDTALIDMGIPTDNTFFTTDTTGMAPGAYNVLVHDTVQRVFLCDSCDFSVPSSFKALNLYYTRQLTARPETVCLPFSVESCDFPPGSLLLSPRETTGNDGIRADTLNSIEAGVPFLLLMPDSVTEWQVRKEQTEVGAHPIDGCLLKGTFQTCKTWESGDYISTEEAGRYRKAQVTDSITAFRAYLHLPDAIADTLYLTNEQDTETQIGVVHSEPTVSSERHKILIENVQGQAVTVYSSEGMMLYSLRPKNGQTIVPINKSGIYLVTVGRHCYKIIIP